MERRKENFKSCQKEYEFQKKELAKIGKLEAEKHVWHILLVENRKDDFELVVTKHLRMNGAY